MIEMKLGGTYIDVSIIYEITGKKLILLSFLIKS